MKLYPSWKGSLVVFGILIVLLLSNFFWQAQRINNSFLEHSLEHSGIIGAVVELNIRNSLMSYTGMETIIGSSLKNSARFISYLHQIEPFNSNELGAFAMESGLSGVRIVWTGDNKNISGPKNWLPENYLDVNSSLHFLAEENLYVFSYSTGLSHPLPDTVIVGMSSEEAETIQKTMSVDNLLALLRKMDGIEYVRFEKYEKTKGEDFVKEPAVIWVDGQPVSENRIKIGDRELVVGLEANYFSSRMQRIKKELLVFVSFLVLFGGFSSWWLYRIQRQRLEQTRRFERKMARQLEQASLGRAAATITHEMRNPLNAISMGLQRLQIEVNSLDKEHKDLVKSMREAVGRSNSVLTNLQQYVNPLKIGTNAIALSETLRKLIVLYQAQCDEKAIELESELIGDVSVTGDGNYLSQAIENLIKNAVEAQAGGGFIKILLSKTENECHIIVENHCRTLTPDDTKMILEPYFTTKTYGTGLGLAISKKIIEAHSGVLKTELIKDVFSARITLPLSNNIAKEQEKQTC